MFKYFILGFVLFTSLFSKDYLLDNARQNDVNITKKHQEFEVLFKKSVKTHKEKILQKWPSLEISSKTKWVQYSNNYKYKKVIDYKKSIIMVSTISNNSKSAFQDIKLLAKEIFVFNIRDALRNDNINKNIYSKLQIIDEIQIRNLNILYDQIDKKEQSKIIKELSSQKFMQKSYKEKKIFTAFYKLNKSFSKNIYNIYEKKITPIARKYKIPKELLLSIVYTNTHFNPLAIDYETISFGFGQLNPKNMAQKAYFSVFGINEFVTARYLFDINNNLNLSAKYLSMLYNNEFKSISNYYSKIYFTIMAYKEAEHLIHEYFNTKDSYASINATLPSFVYKTLLRKTKNNVYLSKAVEHIQILKQ